MHMKREELVDCIWKLGKTLKRPDEYSKEIIEWAKNKQEQYIEEYQKLVEDGELINDKS